MPSISASSSHSRSSSTIAHRCAACCTLFSRPELPHDQSSLKSSRPLPIPPQFPPPVPTLLAPPLRTPSLSTSVALRASHLPSCHSHSPRPLPKMPRSSPSVHGTTGRDTYMNERTSPSVNPDNLAESLPAPQPANNKEIRRGDLSKAQCHQEQSAPSDPVPPDAGELSDNSTSDEKHHRDAPLAPIRAECLSGLTDAASPILEKTAEEVSETVVKQYSRRWLREEKGRRWVEEDYHLVAQFLRELR